MCGFIATFLEEPLSKQQAGAALARMHRRGPDGEGSWQADGVFLGHRRLAILDLDPRAIQPMRSACGRYVIVFNGEIYNFRVLRLELQALGEIFRTTSDTEVILALFAREGEAMLPRLQGMFAFVIWDCLERKAFAARDPYGIKPLFVGQVAGGVALASQVKALIATELVDLAPDPVGQAGFWLLGSVPEPHTWYRDIRAVRAGHCLWVEAGEIRLQRCWHDIATAWHSPAETGAEVLPAPELRRRVRAALVASVDRHLVSDVPVAVFLSGGIDSGALAGLIMDAGAKSLQGITIAYDEFEGTESDEAPMAATLAAHYGIAHHVRRVTRDEFAVDLPRILAAMDQPTIDGVNTWYASKAVAELGLKVVLSGVGGDELFQGYSHFKTLPSLVAIWGKASRVPGAMPLMRAAVAWQAQRSGNARWRELPEWARTMAGAWWLRRGLHAPAELAGLMGPELAAEGLRGFSPSAWIPEMSGELSDDSTLAVGQIESTTYLRNQLLRDSDWASMDHSVELRTPLVDATLLNELAPLLRAFQAFPKKSLLANAPANPLPAVLSRRRKTGFGIPVTRWLRELSRAGSSSAPEQSWAQQVAHAYRMGNE